MIIVTDLLIINHLIFVPVTLPYLALAFKHLNSLPYFIKTFEQVKFTTQCCV